MALPGRRRPSETSASGRRRWSSRATPRQRLRWATHEGRRCGRSQCRSWGTARLTVAWEGVVLVVVQRVAVVLDQLNVLVLEPVEYDAQSPRASEHLWILQGGPILEVIR